MQPSREMGGTAASQKTVTGGRKTGRERRGPRQTAMGGERWEKAPDPIALGQNPWGWRVKSEGSGYSSARDKGFSSHLSVAFDSLAAGKTGIREELPLAPSFPGLIPSPLPHLSMPKTG